MWNRTALGRGQPSEVDSLLRWTAFRRGQPVEGDSLWNGTACEIGQPNGQDSRIVQASIDSVLQYGVCLLLQ
jgi:hypothetical protein